MSSVQQTQKVRADSLSFLQNLGTPLSKASSCTSRLPLASPLPSRLDFSLTARSTRTRKCCKEAPDPDRIASELYPIPAAAAHDLRFLGDVAGAPSRLDGRAAVTYGR